MPRHVIDPVSDRDPGPENTPRLRLKRKAPTVTGLVDGAWWPHTNVLADELPDLLAVLSVRLGQVSRVAYNLAEWTAAPRKLMTHQGLVRLGGFRYQPAHTISVSAYRGEPIELLVVPPSTEADDAHTISMAAASTDDASTVDALLATVS